MSDRAEPPPMPETPCPRRGDEARRPIRVLVCGGRDYDRYVHIYDTLDAIQDERGPFAVIIAGRHPGDRKEEDRHGADYWAESWSWANRIPFYGFPARWGDIDHPDALVRTRANGQQYDAKAGPRRNQRMLDEGRPDLVVAFPGGRGTADMVRRARAAGIPIRTVERSRDGGDDAGFSGAQEGRP